MAKKIVALVDGSIYSASVCDFAAWISGRTGSAVELIHVLGRRGGVEKPDLSGSIKLGARTALLEELSALDEQRSRVMAAHGRAILEDAQAILQKDGVKNITSRLRHGDIVETIGEVEKNAELILIGKRGEAADFAKGHLGSNLERIVRASHKPVFVASRAFKPITKVLVAYDGGASSSKSVEIISQSPLFTGLEFHVITLGVETGDTKSSLESAAAILKSAGLNTQSRFLPGHPESTLGKIVSDEEFDLVVMGAYGHSRVRSLIIGSTTTEMIRTCKAPVLLVR